MGSLTGRPPPSQSPGVGQPCASVLESQVRVNLFWLALPAFALPPSGIELSLLLSSGGCVFALCPPQACGACPTVVTSQEGCSTFSQPRNQFWGASIFTHFSCGTWGSIDSLRAPLMVGGASVETEV